MLSNLILARALLILGSVALAAIIFVLGHGAWLTWSRTYTREGLRRGRAAVAGLVLSGVIQEHEREAVRALPGYVQDRLILELSRSFGGASRDRLRELATEVGAVRRAVSRLGSRLWWKRLQGVGVLSALGASEELMLSRLRDRHPAVRARVAEWAGEHPSPEVLRLLLEMLSTSGTLYRFAVQDAVLRVGRPAVTPLVSYLAGHSGPVVLPALQVASILADPALAAPALTLVDDPHPLVRARAADLLGAVGGQHGTSALCSLLEDPTPAVRAAAAGALARLRHWPSAHLVAPLLRDRAWDVRRAAGLALRDLGGPGLLFLRRFQSDDDRFAADMATQVLSLPAQSDSTEA